MAFQGIFQFILVVATYMDGSNANPKQTLIGQPWKDPNPNAIRFGHGPIPQTSRLMTAKDPYPNALGFGHGPSPQPSWVANRKRPPPKPIWVGP
ncbi:hypothetical protein Peur_037951 [Populus x canadensis]